MEGVARPFSEHWPTWPSDGEGKGKQLVNVVVSWDVNKLFRNLFGSRSAFVVASHSLRANTGYAETPWLPTHPDSEPEICQSPDSSPPVWSPDAAGPCPKEGQLRKVSFGSVAMGMKFTTVEVQRVVEAKAGELYVVEGCVCTTATYGDVFRPITRFRLVAKGTATELTVEYTIMYISPVNRFIKSCIERGADGGLNKNFGQVLGALKQQVTVEDASSARAAAIADMLKVVPSPMSGVPHNAGPALQWGGLLDSELVTIMEAPARHLRRWAPAGLAGDVESVEGQPSKTAQALALLLMLLSMHWTMAYLSQFHTACRQSSWFGATLLGGALDALHLASSLRAVLSSFLLFVLVRHMVTHAAAILPVLLEAFATRRRQISARAAAAALAAAGRMPSSPTEEAPAKGVRFEGYDAAIASATQGSAPSWSGSAESVLQQTMSAMRGMLSPRSMSALSLPAERELSSPTLSPSTSFLGRISTFGRSEEAAGDPVEEMVVQATETSVEGSRSRMPEAELEPSGPRLYEVFENERSQPFRGWGSTWPGHFLPTDRVGHWSARDGAPGGQASMSFRGVAPKLPPGFTWLEEKWHVDLSGQSAEAVDTDGWSFAVDFPWLKMPPIPGSGRMTVKDFVRRRRWIRTRVPMMSAQVLAGQIEGGSPLRQGSGAEFGFVSGSSPIRLQEALSFPHSGSLSEDGLGDVDVQTAFTVPTAPGGDDSPKLVAAVDKEGGQAASVGVPDAPLSEHRPPQLVLPHAEDRLDPCHIVVPAPAERSESDGDSPRYTRYTAHPATVKSPTFTAMSPPTRALPPGTHGAAKAPFKLGIPSWLQMGEPFVGNSAITAKAASDGGENGGQVGKGSQLRSLSNASSDGSLANGRYLPAPPSLLDLNGDTGSEAKGSMLPNHPSPLGIPSGFLTADQAAAAARLLMAGYSMEYAISPSDSPRAAIHKADSGHISFGSGAVLSREGHARPHPVAQSFNAGLSSPEEYSRVAPELPQELLLDSVPSEVAPEQEVSPKPSQLDESISPDVSFAAPSVGGVFPVPDPAVGIGSSQHETSSGSLSAEDDSEEFAKLNPAPQRAATESPYGQETQVGSLDASERLSLEDHDFVAATDTNVLQSATSETSWEWKNTVAVAKQLSGSAHEQSSPAKELLPCHGSVGS